ncbi:MAG: ATP-binding protein [Erysipelotrichaceae bacterium]|nr:ATP-binding protein [Erysipelotrichaceae bacterium]
MIIKRDKYLEKLISQKDKDMIKVITGLRRSGKSFLLFELFSEFLKSSGVNEDQIIKINLDEERNRNLRDAEVLYSEIRSRIKSDSVRYYILLDELQYAITRDELRDRSKPLRVYDLLNSLMHMKNVDVYVTGSNSKFLSKDVMTEFRGRGWPIHIQPLVFSEFFDSHGGSFNDAWEEYLMYGGLPYLLSLKSHEEKSEYLRRVFEEIYLKDIKERYSIQNGDGMDELVNIISSSVGSLTNPSRIANTFKGNNKSISEHTIADYLEYLQDAFLIQRADRYDVKGRKYIGTPSKYYFSDVGLRNVRLNFRQQEKNHLMENIIYNELVYRGYNIDVGVVPVNVTEEGKHLKKQYEIDFVANHFNRRYYIQSALNVDTNEKLKLEQQSLINIPDGFKRVIVVEKALMPWQTEEGTLVIGLKDFLLNDNSLEF